MCTITTTEFKNNFGKYIELGQKEEIIVKKENVIIFRIVPERLKLLKEAEQFYGIFPEGTKIGEDPNERG